MSAPLKVMALHQTFVFAKLSFQGFDDVVDRFVCAIGGSLGEKLNVVAGQVTVGDVYVFFHRERPL